MSNNKTRLRALERRLAKSELDDRGIQEKERALFNTINSRMARFGNRPLPTPKRFLPGMADDILAAIMQGNRSPSGRRGREYIYPSCSMMNLHT